MIFTPAALHIANPCHESWDSMTPNQEGRHCASCAKTVVDVSAMLPSAARDFLTTELPRRISRGEKTCVRAHTDRSGRLLRPGVSRRLLTNGLAGILAVAAAGFAGFGPALGAEDGAPTTPPTQGEPLGVEKGDVAIAAPPIRGEVSLGQVAAPAVVPPITDSANGITVRAEPVSFLVIATDTAGKEAWRVDLTKNNVPADSAHWPQSMTFENCPDNAGGNQVWVSCGSRKIPIRIVDGFVLGLRAANK